GQREAPRQNWATEAPATRPFQIQRLALRAHSHQLLLPLAAHRNLARLRRRHLGDLDYQDAVLDARLDLVLFHIARQLDAAREAAVAQLPAQITALLRARLLL